ncbi:putative kinetochore protein spc24 [Neofusicoccum ribis]|uniref:Kinetochore protein Spc24 n=1 Tax=Neofusicoccum ribis TaxID=45134 RepID=A0ABR3SFX7_9PEZI
MLLDEAPAELIHQTLSNFNVAPDKAALARARANRSNLSALRKSQISHEQATLQELGRKLGSLQSHHNLTTQSHNPTEHAAEILRLDTQKFKIAKQVSDLEIEEERLAQELERLQGELEEVDSQGVEGGDVRKVDLMTEDATVLKLGVYRMLGVHPEMDKASGNYTKATIRNTKKGDAYFVTLDPNLSRYYYADYIWQRL